MITVERWPSSNEHLTLYLATYLSTFYLLMMFFPSLANVIQAFLSLLPHRYNNGLAIYSLITGLYSQYNPTRWLL